LKVLEKFIFTRFWWKKRF